MSKHIKVKFTGSVLNGKLTLDNPDKFKEHISAFEGKKVELELRKAVKSRTSPQTRYYFGVVVRMVRLALQDLGNEVSLEQTHEFLKSMFLFKEVVNENTSEIYKIPLSLSNKGEVSTDIMTEYIDTIIRWASSELSIVIPLPNEGDEYSIDERYME